MLILSSLKLAEDIAAERGRQITQWGGAAHDDQHTAQEWQLYLIKQAAQLSEYETQLINQYGEIGEVQNYIGPAPDYRERLLKIAALAIAALESYDREIWR